MTKDAKPRIIITTPATIDTLSDRFRRWILTKSTRSPSYSILRVANILAKLKCKEKRFFFILVVPSTRQKDLVTIKPSLLALGGQTLASPESSTFNSGDCSDTTRGRTLWERKQSQCSKVSLVVRVHFCLSGPRDLNERRRHRSKRSLKRCTSSSSSSSSSPPTLMQFYGLDLLTLCLTEL
jgi:hypothetical protein